MSVQSDEDDEYLAMVEGQRFRALAAIERVKAIVADLPHQDSRPSTHWADCHKHHYGCLVVKVLAALDEGSTQPKGTT